MYRKLKVNNRTSLLPPPHLSLMLCDVFLHLVVVLRPEGGGLLRTCALRPSGIYGPDERRHLYRVMVRRARYQRGKRGNTGPVESARQKEFSLRRLHY